MLPIYAILGAIDSLFNFRIISAFNTGGRKKIRGNKMEVILLEKIRNLGNLGDKVDVKPGYGRNFLIPQNKAVFATEENIERFEQRRGELEKKAQQSLSARNNALPS